MQTSPQVPRFSLEFLEVASPSARQLALAALILFSAWLVGVLLGKLAGHRIERRLASRPGSLFAGFTGHSVALVRNLTTSIILLAIFQPMAVLDPLRHLMVAGALSLAVTQTSFHLLRGMRLSVVVSTLSAAACFIASLLVTLGSFSSLLDALELISVRFGATRISLLDVTDYLVVVAIIVVMVRIAIALIRQSLASSVALDLYQRTLVQKFANLAVILLGVLVGLGLMGIDFAALAIFSGALGLGVGVGLQKIFGNLLAGISLLLDRSIKPGDVIAVGNTFGSVTRIGARAVSIVTRDGKKYLIPNEQLMTETVENWSYSNPNVRLRIPIGLPHRCDIHRAMELMLDAAHASPRVLDLPQPMCRLVRFGLNAVEFDLQVWIGDPDAGIDSVQSDILIRIWDLFNENGFILPVNQLDVHLRGTVPDLAAGPPDKGDTGYG